MRVVALVGSRSESVFRYLISDPPRGIDVYALVRNGIVPKITGKLKGFLVLSEEDEKSLESGLLSPKEFFPYLGRDDFIFILGFSKGLFPKILAVKESLPANASFVMACVGKQGPKDVQKVLLEELWDFLIKNVPEYPALLNCGLCGLKSCKEYLKRAIKGEKVKCLSNHTFMSVNRRMVEMNPFIIRQMRALVRAYLSTLKGVNIRRMREFHLKLDFE